MSVKNRIFRSRWLKGYNAFARSCKHVLNVSFAIAFILSCILPYLGHRMGERIAIAATAFAVVPVVNSFLIMRYDMLCLLVRTYEFWYLAMFNLAGNGLLCANLGDWRALLVVVLAMMYENSLLIDANYRSVNVAIIASTVGAVFLLAFVALTGFGLSPDVKVFSLFTYGGWTLESSDVIVNCIGTVLVVMLRNGYRKRKSVAKKDGNKMIVRCITYRARVKLVKKPQPNTPSSGSRSFPDIGGEDTGLRPAAPTLVSSSMSDLMVVPSSMEIRADDHLFGRYLRRLDSRIQMLWLIVAAVGVSLSVLSIALSSSHASHALVSIGGLVCSCAYTLPCLLCHNRQLLSHILWSFDFFFLSSQLFVGHLVICVLFRWDWRCLPIISSWLWTHWVVTLDLLTPEVKQKLGIKVQLGLIVLILSILGHAFLCYELVVRRAWRIEDRVLYSLKLSDRSIDFRAIPFLFSRMTTTMSWNCRLLWRLFMRSDDELIMIHGPVEYEDQLLTRRAWGRRAIASNAPPRS